MEESSKALPQGPSWMRLCMHVYQLDVALYYDTRNSPQESSLWQVGESEHESQDTSRQQQSLEGRGRTIVSRVHQNKVELHNIQVGEPSGMVPSMICETGSRQFL